MEFKLIVWLAAFAVAASAKVMRRTACNVTEPPKNWAVALYDGLDVIDVFGPIDVLYILSLSQQLNLYFLADTMAPVWMRPPLPELNKAGSNFTASFNPTHTFDNPPDDIEILLVPGGLGMRRGNSSEPVVDFVRKTYPKVKYLLTTCTGAGVAARAGVLDGKRATTNKAAWNEIVKMGPNVKWVSPARWTVDGNIWTSSGVTSGFDLVFEFVDTVYNKNTSHTIQGAVEYVRAKDPCDDPFAKWHNIPPSGDCRANK
ncbi:Isonitrile hydratase [Metarhizium brunneum]|uniref:Isonitrile hydratase n=1 Tax=Metarhizium brunneum TaxID=500148 RepID=A0A7D5YPS1_9HYPO|nr:Isonitrile hydratase [Metarhizium brunneum]